MIAHPSLPPLPIDEFRVTAASEYRVGGIMSTTIADKLVNNARWCFSERQAIITSGCMITLDADMRAYLEYEADRRRTDIWTIYLEEVAAEKRARAKALSREELKNIARDCTPDPRHLVVDDDPF
jgi:hypothetical protein